MPGCPSEARGISWPILTPSGELAGSISRRSFLNRLYHEDQLWRLILGNCLVSKTRGLCACGVRFLTAMLKEGVMKKRKPYSAGRLLHGPPKKDIKRTGWYNTSTHTFVSLKGFVRWHSRGAKWYGELREMHHCREFYRIRFFVKARDAMIWVEQQHLSRERKKTWKETEA